MLTTKELLGRLREKGIINADIARALKISPSRVTDLFDGTRALKLDEAVKLAEAFDLESSPAMLYLTYPTPVSTEREQEKNSGFRSLTKALPQRR